MWECRGSYVARGWQFMSCWLYKYSMFGTPYIHSRVVTTPLRKPVRKRECRHDRVLCPWKIYGCANMYLLWITRLILKNICKSKVQKKGCRALDTVLTIRNGWQRICSAFCQEHQALSRCCVLLAVWLNPLQAAFAWYYTFLLLSCDDVQKRPAWKMEATCFSKTLTLVY